MEENENPVYFLKETPYVPLTEENVIGEKKQQRDELVAKVIELIQRGGAKEGIRIECVDSKYLESKN